MVLYLKYRPQKLADLDSKEVRTRFAQILSSSFLPHAFLFAGPKGTGKTSAARIVAKVLNCEKRKSVISSQKSVSNQQPTTDNRQLITDIEPCNSCEACISITEGRHLDILEIDAASNRGIEEIRDLREKIKLAPFSAKYKVYIIDEVHMLTNEAFNALLKTLEEPPKHAVFILATTEPDKLLETIVSRCLRFNFYKATKDEIIHSLKRVAKGENIKVDEEVLSMIAGSVDGSFRDATKLLEQATVEQALTLEGVAKILGKTGIASQQFLKLLKERKTKETLEEVVKMGERGADFRFFITDCLDLLHDLLLVQHGVETKDDLADLAASFTSSEINSFIKLFSRVYVELKSASRPEIPLEVAIVEWCEK